MCRNAFLFHIATVHVCISYSCSLPQMIAVSARGMELKAGIMIQAQMKKHNELSVLVAEEQAGKAGEPAKQGGEAVVYRDEDKVQGGGDRDRDVDRDEAEEAGEHKEEAELSDLKNLLGVCTCTYIHLQYCVDGNRGVYVIEM